MFSNKLHPFIVVGKEKKQQGALGSKNENVDPHSSSRPSSVMPVTQQLKHRSPSCLSPWRLALNGWSSALRRPVDSGEKFPSLVTVGFIFPQGGGRAIEEPERRNMGERKTDITERGTSRLPPGLPAHSSWTRRSPSVRRLGALTRWMELVICLCTRLSYCSAFTVRDFLFKKSQEEREIDG